MPDDVPPIPAIDPEDRPAATGRERARKRPLLVRLLPMLIVVLALGSFAGIVGYYYFAGGGSDGVAPLIKADQQPFKIKPENPGGIEVPDQDKEIYNRVGRSSVPPPTAERLLPPPETPLPRPAPSTTVPSVPPAAASPPGTGTSPNLANPNLGGPMLGAAPQTRSNTLSAAPPRPPGTPPPPAASVPPAPDVAPPANVTSQVTLPPAQPAQTSAAPPASTARATPAPASPAPAAPPAATRPPSGPVVRVAIASVRTEPDARREWERQKRLYPDALTSIVPEFSPVDLGEKGVYWRIYVGPAEPGSEAQARCAALKQKRVDCFVARP